MFAASYANTPSFGGRTLPNRGGDDLVIAKLSAQDGSVISSTDYGGAADDGAAGIAVTATGLVYVGGAFMSPSLALGGITLTHSPVTTSNSYDSFVMALSSTGAVMWAKGSANSQLDAVSDVATDSQGNALVVGVYSGTQTMAGLTVSSSDMAGYVMRLRPGDGQGLLAGSFGAQGADNVLGVAVGANDNFVLTGFITTAQSFGGGMLTTRGSLDAFAVNFSAGGAHQWSTSYGSSGMDMANDAAIDSHGATYVAGVFQMTASFAQLVLPSAGSDDGFLIKVTETGAVAWAQRFGGAGRDNCYRVAVDAYDTIYAVGTFYGIADIAGELFTTPAQAGFLVGFWP
jgi:hypothetical protein